jgi:hypothetical protein
MKITVVLTTEVFDLKSRLFERQQRLYSKLSCMEKHSYYPFSSEYQLYSLS